MSKADTPGIPRRRFLGYVVAAPTLVTAVRAGFDMFSDAAFADVPTLGASDLYDLTDMLTDAARPTANLITITMTSAGEAVFALPRAEVGQGITTAFSMIIADEMDLPVEKVRVSLSDARPELVWNQITGGSNSVHSLYTPVRVAAAIARNRLLDAAAIVVGDPVARLSAYQGLITAPSGGSVSFGDVASAAASPTTMPVGVALKPTANLSVVSTPRGRVDALDIVTGRKQFAMDLDVPGALPTMVCRPPTINGTVVRVRNQTAVLAMPGITDVAVIPTGVAVRGETFGQCIDAVRALDVQWGGGTVDGKSDAAIRAALIGAEQPMPTASLPALATTIDHRFTFAFASNSPLETNCAVADVRPDRAEIWSSLKTPIIAQQRIAEALGLPNDSVTCHVVEGGGSFGRHLFSDAALEAALASRAFGKPVKLMWHRTDDFRQGRMHPMSTSRVRASCLAGNVLTYEQRHSSVSTDFRHGLGEVITATMANAPAGNSGFATTVFELTQNVPYNFGAVDQTISEVEPGFNTGSMRNIYSPNVTTARELVVDQLAKAMNQDAYQFRRQFLRDDRMLAALDHVAQAGRWGRRMSPGTAQGIALHSEYKSRAAVLVEIDCRPATVNRSVTDGYTGPRVTKAVVAVDVGLPINPRGLEAQMLGGLMDGIGLALTFSVHISDGHSLEGSWDNTFYTRQWNVPFDVEVIIMPATGEIPGGAGELAVAPSFAAVACAYARATNTVPTTFPINHDRSSLGFEPLPTVPPIPESPVDGLAHTF
jgi:isoquinoline 1-oxidoreductase beta subunit